MGVGGGSAGGGAILVAARNSPSPAGTPAVATPPEHVEQTPREPAANAPATIPVARARAKKPAASKTAAAATRPATLSANEAAVTNAPDLEVASKTVAPEPSAVTITGCLERDDETFRLKDGTGLEGRKSRSWKSGFLKKGSASVEVVDAAHRLHLTNHIGQRVSITGMLVDREMEGRTLRRVAASCD